MSSRFFVGPEGAPHQKLTNKAVVYIFKVDNRVSTSTLAPIRKRFLNVNMQITALSMIPWRGSLQGRNVEKKGGFFFGPVTSKNLYNIKNWTKSNKEKKSFLFSSNHNFLKSVFPGRIMTLGEIFQCLKDHRRKKKNMTSRSFPNYWL